jgi:hypothetical protein
MREKKIPLLEGVLHFGVEAERAFGNQSIVILAIEYQNRRKEMMDIPDASKA